MLTAHIPHLCVYNLQYLICSMVYKLAINNSFDVIARVCMCAQVREKKEVAQDRD